VLERMSAARRQREELNAQIAEGSRRSQRPEPYPTARYDCRGGAEPLPSLLPASRRPRLEGLRHGSGRAHGRALQPVSFEAAAAGRQTSHRRRQFAEWIASEENPLTARVMVNRIWQHHFGEGIVRTPSNFGKTGQPPSHPELLDWLATEFVRSGWSSSTCTG
jgi:hypothetical protein